jgi:hypothetical protein
MDIRFDCPRCGQNLAVDERGAGMVVNCPACKGEIRIPEQPTRIQIPPVLQVQNPASQQFSPPPPTKSNVVAGFLGLFLGPVGLWYKGHWAAGFAWLAMAIIVGVASGGFGIVVAPIFWIGMTIHAIVAQPNANQRPNLPTRQGELQPARPSFAAMAMLIGFVALGSVLILWLIGLVSSYTLGGLIHILLVLAIIVVIINLIKAACQRL